jgi:hypothetical protein
MRGPGVFSKADIICFQEGDRHLDPLANIASEAQIGVSTNDDRIPNRQDDT